MFPPVVRELTVYPLDERGRRWRGPGGEEGVAHGDLEDFAFPEPSSSSTATAETGRTAEFGAPTPKGFPWGLPGASQAAFRAGFRTQLKIHENNEEFWEAPGPSRASASQLACRRVPNCTQNVSRCSTLHQIVFRLRPTVPVRT